MMIAQDDLRLAWDLQHDMKKELIKLMKERSERCRCLE